MNRKTALTLSLVVFLSTPQFATAGMGSALESLFGSVTGRGEESFQVAKKKALADKDPWHAWLELSASDPGDISSDIREPYSELAASLVLSAARKNNPDALVLVFSRDDAPGFVGSRPELYEPLLTLAEKAAGNRKDKELLMAAGDILQKGQWTIKDSQRAAGYYSRAWLAGENSAPAKIYSVYQELQDPGSAYLWQLRCIGNCRIWQDESYPQVTQLLNPRQIQWIQKQARDKTVITVNGLSALKELR
uniref:Sel1 repeat family protein n=1 Tax=Enterobacter cloacae TaxID=550 RepID=A0A1S6XY89_ENTCL|nr:hypothetical protein [Enterobacter cloacae]AQX35396.1 hypothetical protein PIMI5_00083 [Enterobacter cloacae]